jgi:hypothetical protein
VILKDGFQTSELESGVDFEVKEKYRNEGKHLLLLLSV